VLPQSVTQVAEQHVVGPSATSAYNLIWAAPPTTEQDLRAAQIDESARQVMIGRRRQAIDAHEGAVLAPCS